METKVNSEDTSWVVVGTILKACGLKGEIKIFPHTDDLGRFSHAESVAIRKNGKSIAKYSIASIRKNQKLFIVRFHSITTREEAEDLQGAEMVIPIESVPALPDGSYYIFELIGLTVVDEHGEEKGKIIDVYTQSAHDIYVVDWNGREILIPAVGEFIKK